jgi:isoaspartyl peptidase/L-asparaginase-like protein (Ntn-hydrolase superfamily)
MRTLATRAVSEAVEHGATLVEAVQGILDRMGRQFDADVGIIAVDRNGVTVAQHRTPAMPHAFFEGNGRDRFAHAPRERAQDSRFRRWS